MSTTLQFLWPILQGLKPDLDPWGDAFFPNPERKELVDLLSAELKRISGFESRADLFSGLPFDDTEDLWSDISDRDILHYLETTFRTVIDYLKEGDDGDMGFLYLGI